MRSPTIDQLSPPSSGNVGWPWTQGSTALPDIMPDGRPWPRISLITPSHNQGQYIEETIRSVLLQGYPNYEYFVIDGDSTDGSQEIIAKYTPWLTYWVSEPDRGQAHAINKGLALIKGDIWNWLNSDDVLCPDAFQSIGSAYSENPKALVVGDVEEFWDKSASGTIFKQEGIGFRNMVEFWYGRARWHQPGIFSPVSFIGDLGVLDESLDYALDYDFFCRICSVGDPVYLDRILARARAHKDSKTITDGHRFALQNAEVSSRYWGKIPNIDVPDYIRSHAALSFRQGCRWLFIEGRKEGISLIAEALRTDPFGVLLSNLKSSPDWLRRRFRNGLKKWQGRAAR
jgi:glycosyltransferase involved in cell wall biosynthesis